MVKTFGKFKIENIKRCGAKVSSVCLFNIHFYPNQLFFFFLETSSICWEHKSPKTFFLLKCKDKEKNLIKQLTNNNHLKTTVQSYYQSHNSHQHEYQVFSILNRLTSILQLNEFTIYLNRSLSTWQSVR